MIKLSVIIPAYNEEKRIARTLVDVNAYLEKQPYEYEIIVVDNNSKDGLEEKISKFKEVIFIQTGKNLDEALIKSYQAVRNINWDGMQFRRDIGKTL